MAIDTITPVENSVIDPGDSFSFTVDDTYTSLTIEIQTDSGTEFAYDTALSGAQGGYVVSVENSGGRDTFTVSRSAGWNQSPQQWRVIENESGSNETTTTNYFLTNEDLFPDDSEPYFPVTQGTLTITEDDDLVTNIAGQLDFDDATFNVTNLGNGKVRIVGLGGGGTQDLSNVILTAGGGTVDNDVTVLSSDPLIFRDGAVAMTSLTLHSTQAQSGAADNPPPLEIILDSLVDPGITVRDATSANLFQLRNNAIVWIPKLATANPVYQIGVQGRDPADTLDGGNLFVFAGTSQNAVATGGSLSLFGGFGGLEHGKIIIAPFNTSEVDFGIGFSMLEAADHPVTPVATKGQWWVRNFAPCAPMFTDDVGNDYVLNTGGDVVGPGSSVDNELAIFDGLTGKLLQGSSGQLVYAGGQFSLGGGTASLRIAERATGPTNTPGTGFHWVRNDAPSVPMFTNDIGGEFVLNSHPSLTGLGGDDHTQYLLLAGRAGGQSAFGGTAAADNLTLEANIAAGVASGRIVMNSAVEFNSISATGAPYAFNYNATESYTGGFVGGGLNMSGSITFSNSTFIYESFRGAPTITTAVNPGFAAYTVLQALPNLNAGSGAGHNPLAPLVLNAGPRVINAFSGVRTTSTMAAISWVPTVQAAVSGATMSVTNITGITNAPKYSTVSGSAAAFGTIRAVHCQNPAPALFAPGAGVESMTAYIGLDMNNISFGGNVTKAAVRSAQTAASNAYFLLNTGGAQSDFGNSNLLNCRLVQCLSDTFGLSLGAAGGDVQIVWNGSALEYDPAIGDDLRWSFASGSHTLQSALFGTNSELRLGFDRFTFGSTSPVGNQVGVFTAPVRTTGVNGGWSDFLLTQAGNITVDHTISQLTGWTINSPSITIGTGSVIDAVGMLIGGNVNAGTNRYGLLVLSSPTGGTLNYCARFQGAAGVRIDGLIEHTGTTLGFYGTTPAAQSATYTRNATIVESRTLLASASATTLNNNNVLAALIADLQAIGILG